MDGAQRISINPQVCGGRPVVSGTRLRVTDILGMLADGVGEAEILTDFPFITADDIRATLAYAARALDHSVVLAA